MTQLWDYQNNIFNRKNGENRFFIETFVDEIYKVALKENDVVIDIGACYGEFSAYIYNQAKIIYAIEAHLPTFKELETYINQYKLMKIHPFHLAMTGYNGQRYLQEKMVGGHCLTNEITSMQVTGKTLYTFMLENNIEHADIVKMDVEGAEAEIINADDFKMAASKIDLIIGEHCYSSVKPTLEALSFDVIAEVPGFIARKK